MKNEEGKIQYSSYFFIIIKIVIRNERLRGQLEESHSTNEALTNDLQKLTNDFEGLREEMIIKEDEWKDEEQAFNDYYSSEHTRLLNLWRDVVSIKRLFVDVQSTTERDLVNLKTDFSSFGRDLALACSRMDRNITFESIIGVNLVTDESSSMSTKELIFRVKNVTNTKMKFLTYNLKYIFYKDNMMGLIPRFE